MATGQDARTADVAQIRERLRHAQYRLRPWVGAALGLTLVLFAEPVWWGFLCGAAFCAAGAALRLWAAGLIRKSRVLERRGPYSFVRHPQYLGNTLIAVGLCVASGHLWATAAWPLVYALFYGPAIRHEDAKLQRRFGEAWRAWSRRTPALFSARLPAGPLHLRQWSVRQALRNGEPAWQLLLLAGLLSVVLRLPGAPGA